MSVKITEFENVSIGEPLRKWLPRTADLDATETLIEQLNIHPLVARVLTTRSCSRVDTAREFLSPDRSSLYSPSLMHDLDKAVKRIRKAIDTEEKIVVIGDYDVDGVTSTTLLIRTLRSLKAQVDYIIPSRVEDGYGINVKMVQACFEKSVGLIITVDNGVAAVEPARVARQLGIDLIVTDHHHLPDELPKAFAIVHPCYPRAFYPTATLCGCGVAFKLAQALLGRFPEEHLELVAMGTLADQMSLLGENRLLVQLGLQQLTLSPSLGVFALLYVSGLENKRITANHIHFQVAPRINAVGRMAHAARVVELFLTEDPELAMTIANEMSTQNRFRQTIQERVEQEALQQIADHPEWLEGNTLVVALEGAHEGVIGIVAGNLTERFYKPTLCLSIDGDMAKGSGRSIDGFDLYEALRDVQERSYIFAKYGGHSAAAGFSLHAKDIERLREGFAYAARRKWTDDILPPHIYCDAPLRLNEMSFKLSDDLKRLEPYGQANPQPVFFVKNVVVGRVETMGTEGKHLKLWVEDDSGRGQEVVAFNRGHEIDHWEEGTRHHLVVKVEENIWQTSRKVQLHLVDHRTAQNV
ncbi:single-stranded-DNA-specific exonuclease RecJ [Alicyclobacillus fodiniaquatilis]|uniref:Single-stranded-DNA-specific exonuclease RecJ n=1 Tax=Alicyclobacillus fodiniaquatilis TaxID=1661150 RepID=A0ABW4JI09_9BACL